MLLISWLARFCSSLLVGHRSWQRAIVWLAVHMCIVSVGSEARGEESSQKVIRLEEITLVDFIQRPSLFFQLNGAQSIAPLQPSGACPRDGQVSTPACRDRGKVRVDYEKAMKSWSKVAIQRNQLEEAVQGLIAPNTRRRERRRVPPIIDELLRADPQVHAELPDLLVVPLGGQTAELDNVFETILQARGAMKRCAEEAALGQLQGAPRKVSFLIEIVPDGTLQKIHAARDGSESKAVSCITPVLKALRFPEQSGEEGARIAVLYSPETDRPAKTKEGAGHSLLSGAKVWTAGSTSSLPAKGAPSMSFSLGNVREILNSSMGELSTCFMVVQREGPVVAGRVTVTFIIGEGGIISAAAIDNSTLSDEVGACLVTQLFRLRLPAPEGGDVPFTHTFIFRP